MSKIICKSDAFTLLEVIIIFVVGAVLASMTMPYFFSGAMKANTPIDRLQISSNLNQCMEAVVYDHDTNFASPTNTILNTTFAAKVTALQTNYASSCQNCTASVGVATFTPSTLIQNPLLVTITSSTGEKIYHVFTVQN